MATTTVRKRLSLTKTDIQTTAGLELVQILQSITDDGHVEEAEVHQLREWLTQNVEVALPSREYLTHTINDVLKDGVISDDEIDLLHDAVLRVLPTELRAIATLRRRERRNEEREELKETQREEKARKQEERDKNRPLQRADFMAAGATYGDDRRAACEGCCDDDPVTLEREPENQHDTNAILVLDAGGNDLGYVPRDLAKDLAPLLDEGAKQDFRVKKLIETSRGFIIPVIAGALYRADAVVPAVVNRSNSDGYVGVVSMNSPRPSARVTEPTSSPTAVVERTTSPQPTVRPKKPALRSPIQPIPDVSVPGTPWSTLDIAIWVGAAFAIAILFAVLMWKT